MSTKIPMSIPQEGLTDITVKAYSSKIRIADTSDDTDIQKFIKQLEASTEMNLNLAKIYDNNDNKVFIDEYINKTALEAAIAKWNEVKSGTYTDECDIISAKYGLYELYTYYASMAYLIDNDIIGSNTIYYDMYNDKIGDEYYAKEIYRGKINDTPHTLTDKATTDFVPIFTCYTNNSTDTAPDFYISIRNIGIPLKRIKLSATHYMFIYPGYKMEEYEKHHTVVDKIYTTSDNIKDNLIYGSTECYGETSLETKLSNTNYI